MKFAKSSGRCLAATALFAGLAMSSTAGLADDAQKFHGEYEFKTFCASCHGLEGKGDGPMASALKTPPTDVTRLTDENDGVFPYDRVFAQIQGREVAVVHGREMPLWGERYNLEVHDQAIVRARVLELVTYIKSIQK